MAGEEGGGGQKGRGRHSRVGGEGQMMHAGYEGTTGREVRDEVKRVRSYEIQVASDPQSTFAANYRSPIDPFQTDRDKIDE